MYAPDVHVAEHVTPPCSPLSVAFKGKAESDAQSMHLCASAGSEHE